MVHDPKTIERLKTFRQKDKFSDHEFEKRGLMPSDGSVTEQMSNGVNSCLDELLEIGNSSSEVKKIIVRSIKRINKDYYDTEEKEFIADCFNEISTIVNVDIKDELNKWLYGWLMAAIVKTKRIITPEHIVETLHHPCAGCEVDLETQILRKEIGIPDYAWLIVRCNNCETYNLLSLIEGVKEARHVTYQIVEQLPKEDFTEDQAKVRLEQIKYFRK